MDTDATQDAGPSASSVSATQVDARAGAVEDTGVSVTAEEIGAERLKGDGGDDQRPTVENQAWLKQDNYWQRTTYIAVTGRHTATAPLTRPLPRPHRFREPSRARSILVLALTLALIVVIPLGVVMAQHAAEANIKLPTSIPGLTEPTPTHTLTPTVTARPTVTPKKK